jgi:dGTPase
MEVAQISRDIARAMRLNEDLAECIALAHDIGHPPFGHSGEEALNTWMLEQGLHFEHNEQSHRIVTVLEKRSTQYAGLNLNREVEYGLLKHSATHPLTKEPIVHSLEAQVANLADEIAYTSHDCDDGLLAKLFKREELVAIPLAKEAWERAQQRGTHLRGSLVHLMVKDMLAFNEQTLDDTTSTLSFSSNMRAGIQELRSFLSSRMYPHPRVRTKARDGMMIIDLLCRHYMEHPTEKITNMAERTGEGGAIAIKDYVAGMTDNFAWLQAAEQGLLEGIEEKDEDAHA